MRASSLLARAPRLFLALTVLLIPACSKGPKVYPVRGQLLVDGKPAAQATVTFHPVGGAASAVRPSAQTDDQGYFTLTTQARGDGAPEGDYDVTVTWFRAFTAPQQAEGEAKAVNLLPPRYANPTTSKLKAAVTRGNNELPPLQVSAR
jgi:hypothetical protein